MAQTGPATRSSSSSSAATKIPTTHDMQKLFENSGVKGKKKSSQCLLDIGVLLLAVPPPLQGILLAACLLGIKGKPWPLHSPDFLLNVHTCSRGLCY